MAGPWIHVSDAEGAEVALPFEAFQTGLDAARLCGWAPAGSRLLGAGPHWPGWYEPQRYGKVVVDLDDAHAFAAALGHAFAELDFSRDREPAFGASTLLLGLSEEERVALAEVCELAERSPLVLSLPPG
jgi:hypothetical protein